MDIPPRPWRVDGVLILDATGRVVASAASYEPVTVEQLKANAAAIVAAVNQQPKEQSCT